ncbi:hypothetical protein [Brochothrix thermosphacta]|uniref:hypothetical protein n=1 Tax=Brochothrix thermosphacta TaxID=2756 RepID=UPI00083FC713|nr:hypothetical protein [Brochothrix thermosphacta]ODJ69291.1 hypothetical protein BFR43_11100 [Brochothrix thermosphacta]
MLTVVKSYAVFNLKMLLKDKIPLLWSILLPVIAFFMNRKNVNNEWDLSYWWVYIIVCCYIYGVGLYALQLKETGSLKTIFSIKNSPLYFFLGNLLTKVIFSFISVNLLNLIVVTILPLSFFKLLIYSTLTIFACIPVAFLGYNITLLKKIHANTVNSIFTIVIFSLFILLNTNHAINKYNPLLNLANLLISHSVKDISIFVLSAIVIIMLSLYAVLKFEATSNERR